AVAGVVGNGAAKESDRGGRLFIGEDFDIGQAGRVVDRDVDVFPADGSARNARGVAVDGRVVAPSLAVSDTFAGAALDPPELLDIDVDQLARPVTLVALRGLKAQAPELAHPELPQDPGHRGVRHLQALSDLHTGQPQPTQR